MKDKTLVFAIVLGLIIFLSSGCMGGKIPEAPEGEEGEGGITGASWCEAGKTIEYADQGGGFTYEIKGIEEYDGEEMCKSVHITQKEGKKMKTIMYQNEDGSKRCIISKNMDNDTIVEESCVSTS